MAREYRKKRVGTARLRCCRRVWEAPTPTNTISSSGRGGWRDSEIDHRTANTGTVNSAEPACAHTFLKLQCGGSEPWLKAPTLRRSASAASTPPASQDRERASTWGCGAADAAGLWVGLPERDLA
jgi:hypothetical protein